MDSNRHITYEIKVEGLLDPEWSDWFDGLGFAREGDNSTFTTLTGALDQSALRGVLNKIWDLNLTLLSVISRRESRNVSSMRGGDDE